MECQTDVRRQPIEWVECPGCAADLALLKDFKRCPKCGGALLKDVLIGHLAARAEVAPTVTLDVPDFGTNFIMPKSGPELRVQGPSALGFSVNSGWIACPERLRLKALGLKPKITAPPGMEGVLMEMDNLDYGLYIHALLGARVIWGQEFAEQACMAMTLIHPTDKQKALNILKTYDITYPLAEDPFYYLGIEVEVASDVGDGRGGSLIRTVRYDALVTPENGEKIVYSLERKTASRGGWSSMDYYLPQFYSQVAVWNANPHLVDKYGPMHEIIPEQIVKTVVPRVERFDEFLVSEWKQQLAIKFLRLPEQVKFPSYADGTYAQMLPSCIDRFRRCEYFDLCHNQMHNAYEIQPKATA